MKFVKTESGKTNAARPSNTNAVMTPETPRVPPKLKLLVFHFVKSRASVPTYRNMNVSAIKDNIANTCLEVILELSVTLYDA
jgi:hypothetical protein